MNNIEQKNIILSFKENNKIPYSENDVGYYDKMALNEPIINNTLQQLRDNDLFIENEILNKTKYNIGPKTYSENGLVSDYTNGMKYWNILSEVNDVQILRKKNQTITDTISKIADNNVSFIFNVGTYIFAGFSDGVKYVIDNDSTNSYTYWKPLINGTPYTYLNYNEIVLFAVDKKIYTYKKSQDDSLDIVGVEKSDEFESMVTSIGYDKNTAKIFVGTQNGNIYESKQRYDIDVNVKCIFEKHDIKNSVGESINDFMIKTWNNDYNQTNYITSLCGNKILRSNYESILLNEKEILNGKNISDVIKIDDDIYVAIEDATNGGIYKLNNDEISDTPNISGSIKKMFILDDTGNDEIYYLDGEQKKIYKLNDSRDGGVLIYDLSSYNSINDFCIVKYKDKRLLIVATDDEIIGIYNPSDVNEAQVLTIDESANQVKASIKNNILVIYAHTSDKLMLCRAILQDNDIVKYENTNDIKEFECKKPSTITDDQGIYSYYRGDIVYVNGTSICRLDNGEYIHTFGNNIKRLFKNYNKIGNFMYVVYLDNDDLYLIYNNDKKQLTIPADVVDKDNITNIVIGNEYLFITTKFVESGSDPHNIVYILSQPYDDDNGNYQCSYVGKAVLDGDYDSGIQIFEYNGTIYIKQNRILKKYEIQRGVDIQKINNLTPSYTNTHLANCFSRGESLLAVDGNLLYYLSLSAGTGKTYSTIINKYDKANTDNQFSNYRVTTLTESNVDQLSGLDLYDNNYLIYSDKKILQYTVNSIDNTNGIEPNISVDLDNIYHACYIDGNIYVSGKKNSTDSDGLYQVIDKTTTNILTATPYANIVNPTTWDAQGNIFYGENFTPVNVVTIAYLNSNDNVTVVNDEKTISEILPNTIQRDGIEYTITGRSDITMCLNDGLYTSYKASAQVTDPENNVVTNTATFNVTQLNGYLDQGELSNFSSDVLFLDNNYYSQIKRAFKSRNSLFVNDTGCYIDSYTYGEISDGNVNITTRDIYENDGGIIILKPRSSQMMGIYSLVDGEKISSINSYGYNITENQDGVETSNTTRGVVAINLGSKIKLVPVTLNNKLYCKIDNDDDSYIDIQPAQVVEVGTVRTYSVVTLLDDGIESNVTNIKNVCVKIDDSNTYIYCHIGTKIYKRNIDINATTIKFETSDQIIDVGNDGYMEQSQDGSVVVVYIDNTNNKVLYDIDTYQIIATIAETSTYKALGNLAYNGFVEMDSSNDVTTVKTFEKRQDGYELYKNDKFSDKIIKKFLGYENLLYYIYDNKLYCQNYEYLMSPNFELCCYDRNIIKNENNDNIIDFEVSEGMLYCLFDEQNGKYVRVFNVICVDNILEYSLVGTYTFNYSLDKIQTIGEIFSNVISNGKTLLFRESNGKTINAKTPTPVWCYSTSEADTLGSLDGDLLSTVNSVWIDDSNHVFIHDNDNVYDLDDLTSSIVSSVTGFKPANEFFMYSTDSEKSKWYLQTSDDTIDLGDISDSRKIYRENNQLYLTKDDGIYEPEYELSIILDIDTTDTGLNEYYQNIPLVAGNNIIDSQVIPGKLDLYMVLSSNGEQSYWTYYQLAGTIVMNRYDGVVKTDTIKYKYDRAMLYGTTKLVYNDGGFYFSDDEIKFADWSTTVKKENLNIDKYFYVDDKFYLLLSNDNKRVLTFTGYKNRHRFFEEINNATDSSTILYKFMDIGNNQYLIKSNKGIYLYRNNTLCKITNGDTQYTSLLKHSFDSNEFDYYYSTSGNVYKSKTWQEISITDINKIFNVQDANKINDLFPINEYTWLIATDIGLYKSNYKYDLENDLTYFDEKEVNDIYKSTLSTEVSEIVNDKISSHVNIMHNDKSIIGLVNNKIQDVDVSKNVTNWYSTSQKTLSGEIVDVCTNDTIDDIWFGDQTDNTLSVKTDNFIGVENNNKFNYIIKKYKSGMIELYILIDSTNTYYINHVSGAGASHVHNTAISRNNLDGVVEDTALNSDDISNLGTKITIAINKSKFDIKDVFECVINGCSLPLKIYRDIDEIKSRSEIQNMYQSLVLQSKFVMNSGGELYTSDGYYQYFNAVCFGTDQQSIKLQFTVNPMSS